MKRVIPLIKLILLSSSFLLVNCDGTRGEQGEKGENGEKGESGQSCEIIENTIQCGDKVITVDPQSNVTDGTDSDDNISFVTSVNDLTCDEEHDSTYIFARNENKFYYCSEGAWTQIIPVEKPNIEFIDRKFQSNCTHLPNDTGDHIYTRITLEATSTIQWNIVRFYWLYPPNTIQNRCDGTPQFSSTPILINEIAENYIWIENPLVPDSGSFVNYLFSSNSDTISVAGFETLLNQNAETLDMNIFYDAIKDSTRDALYKNEVLIMFRQ